jgi:osmoprotectant transport system permease protein
MTDFVFYITENWITVLRLTVLHVGLVLLSSAIAIAIALPLGIFVTRPQWRVYANSVLTIGNTFQTVPTLAVIGLASAALSVVKAGIGWWPAILALVIYSILPVLTNTIAGIEGIPRPTLKAGLGMGFTENQLLTKIDLPLAFPVILAGIRTAVVINIGTAALAAAIGADCLGTLIFQGISTGSTEVLLAGAVPTAMLAIAVDFGFAAYERVKIPAELRRKEI